MANIVKTDIGTSRPVSICKGKALIPPAALNFGVDGTKTIWNTNPNLLAIKLHLDVSFVYFFGFCGPGWGVCMNVEGNTIGNKVNLNVTDDQLTAGLILGASVGLKFDMSSEKYGCWVKEWHWWGPDIACGWGTGLDVSPTLSLDILKLAYESAKLILGKESALKPANKPEEKESVVSSPFGIQSYGISDLQVGTFADNNGLLKATPVFSIPVNIWSVLVNMDKTSAICGGSAVALNATLKAAHVTIGFGPSFGLAFPVNVKMHEIYLDDVKYANLSVTGNTVSGTTTGTPPTNASVGNISVRFAESPGIDFYFGIFASVSAFEVFSFAYETGWGLLDLFGVKASIGPFYENMASTAGRVLTKACDSCGVNNGLREVVFE